MEELILQNITKTYPGVIALDDVSMKFKKGEVHAIVGENGAGKSTFIKIISGAVRPDSGTIAFDEDTFSSMTPKLALELGISVVYQELIQFESLTVADNIFMGTETSGGLVKMNDRLIQQKTQELLNEFNCPISPAALIRDLSIANRQIIEIAKAVAKKAKVIIMDEPTAAITVEEQEYLFHNIKRLKKEGVTVIYISHRLEELFEICDRVSVLRDGKYIKTLDIAETTKDKMISLMVGRDLSETYPPKDKPSNTVKLKVENLIANRVNNVSFELHKGEILGIGGLVGSGRTELMHAIYGAAHIQSGKVYIDNKEVHIKSPSEGLKAGIGIVPEDRKWQGCFIDKPIYWNISVANLKSVSKGIQIDRKKETELADTYRSVMRIKTPNLKQLVSNLSGGNQQKVVAAKVLATEPEIMIFDEPTRGIDVGARYEIYTIMVELTKQGKSIIMVSSDMEELLGMSDRLIVLYEGEIKGTVKKEEFSQELVMEFASGLKQGEK